MAGVCVWLGVGGRGEGGGGSGEGVRGVGALGGWTGGTPSVLGH